MQLTSIALVSAFLTVVNAWNITETYDHVSGPCKTECDPWVATVGDCISATNQTYNASMNVADLNSFQFSGDLNPLGECACTAVAVQSSQSCLGCLSERINLEPALSMQDYFMVCQNPMNAITIFSRYHKWVEEIATTTTEYSTTPTESSTAVGSGGGSYSSSYPNYSSSSSSSSSPEGASSTTPCPITRRNRH